MVCTVHTLHTLHTTFSLFLEFSFYLLQQPISAAAVCVHSFSFEQFFGEYLPERARLCATTKHFDQCATLNWHSFISLHFSHSSTKSTDNLIARFELVFLFRTHFLHTSIWCMPTHSRQLPGQCEEWRECRRCCVLLANEESQVLARADSLACVNATHMHITANKS